MRSEMLGYIGVKGRWTVESILQRVKRELTEFEALEDSPGKDAITIGQLFRVSDIQALLDERESLIIAAQSSDRMRKQSDAKAAKLQVTITDVDLRFQEIQNSPLAIPETIRVLAQAARAALSPLNEEESK